jgi:hypothetical protein
MVRVRVKVGKRFDLAPEPTRKPSVFSRPKGPESWSARRERASKEKTRLPDMTPNALESVEG